MVLEDKLPDAFKKTAFRPSNFDYAWRRKELDELFEELMQWNFVIVGGEVWVVEGKQVTELIPLKSGDIKVFLWKIKSKNNEEWFDFVERSIKESLQIISEWDLEKRVRIDIASRIFYHFSLKSSFS